MPKEKEAYRVDVKSTNSKKYVEKKEGASNMYEPPWWMWGCPMIISVVSIVISVLSLILK